MTTPPADHPPVVVIGAGLAGLACACDLHASGTRVVVLEASDGVGGRVRTDRVETAHGPCLVDRGFQVYLTAYPEGRRVLPLDRLGLRHFLPGALVHFEGRLRPVVDPLRAPVPGLRMIAQGSALLERRDLLALARFDLRWRFADPEAAWSSREESAEAALRQAGLSERVIERFFRPFFGGVFLDRRLATSARKLRYTYRMFARGRAALPEQGMEAIPRALAAALPGDALRLGTCTARTDAGSVTTDDGEVIEASAVVVATDGEAASALVGGLAAPRWKWTTAVTFLAPHSPVPRPLLCLDGEGTGPANHVAVVSDVQPGYAPTGRALVSANIVAPVDVARLEPSTEAAVREQMRAWFGPQVDRWEHVRTDRIRHALPDEDAPALDPPRRPVETDRVGVFVAGDHRDDASINGALVSGRRAADAVRRHLAPGP